MMTKIGVIIAAAALVVGLAVPAYAGPQITFGPDNIGMMQLDYKAQFQMMYRNTGTGANNDDSTANFDFRRNRLALMGAYGDVLSIYVQTDFTDETSINALGVDSTTSSANFQMLDAVIRFNFSDAFKVNVGKFKYNFSRENLEACEDPLTLDRSLFIRAPFVTTRDTGVAVWGNAFKDIFQYRLDAMNGRKTVSGDTSPQANLRYSMRAHVTLLDPESDYGYKGTYMGKKKVLTIGGAYQTESDIAYNDTVNKIGPKNYTASTVDAFFEYPVENIGTATVSGAYVKYKLGNAYQGANPDSGTIGLDGEKNGWYVKAGYMLPGFPLQVFGRYEKWKFATLNNVIDQRIDWKGLGVNYYIREQNLKVTVEYAKTGFDKEGTFNGLRTKNFDTVITQLQLIF
jgi:hypothetical protein